MNPEIERYLNDHLAGASGALLMIQQCIDTFEEPHAVQFFKELKSDVEADRRLLEQLLTRAGLQPSGMLKTAGNLTARIGLLKLMWEGFDAGELGLFEGLEMLAIGVQGKRLLWVTLKEICHWYPEWKDFDFAALELEAIRQRDGVEFWRIEAARDTFVSAERRAVAASA